ncbi:MAG: PKD domain-containing protein [Bacteroidota bacterium]
MKTLYIIPIAAMVAILQGCYPDPVANFDYSFTDNTAPAEITFINMSEEADSYRWEFGDGDISTETNPVHTFTQAGTYTVALMAKGRGGEHQTTKNVTITQPTTYIVRNLSSVTLYEVMSFYHNGTEIEAYYEHGTMTPNSWSLEVITEYSSLQLYFELADGAMCIVIDSYPMISRTLNYMDFDDETYYYYEYPAKKSTSVTKRTLTLDDIQRIRETGKTGQLKDLMKGKEKI